MRRYTVLAVGVTLVAAVLALITPGPVIAQTFKPVMSFIVNDTANAVPVRVVSTAAPSVVCALDLGPSIGPAGAFYLAAGSKASTQVSCADGSTKVDVRRLTYSPDVGTITSNVASYRLTVSVATAEFEGVVGIVTDGAPTTDVMRTFRLDTTSDDPINWRNALTSGIAEYAPKSGGTLFFIGTPLP
jgi:hypothetical protein